MSYHHTVGLPQFHGVQYERYLVMLEYLHGTTVYAHREKLRIETRVTDVGYGAHLGQRVVLAVPRCFHIESNNMHQSPLL